MKFCFLCDHSRCLWHPWAAHILVLWPWTTVRWYWWFRFAHCSYFQYVMGIKHVICVRSTCNCNRSTMSLEVDMNSQLVVSLTVWIGEPSLAHLCSSEIPTQILDLLGNWMAASLGDRWLCLVTPSINWMFFFQVMPGFPSNGHVFLTRRVMGKHWGGARWYPVVREVDSWVALLRFIST